MLRLRQHSQLITNVRMAMFSSSFMKLEMPALSPTMSSGTIVKWNIQEGGKVDIGDVICEIQTDKATVGFESQEEGYIAKIFSGDGSVMECGGLIGIMVDEKDDIANVDYSAILSGSAAPKTETAPVEAPKAASLSQQSASVPGTEEFYEELERILHDPTTQVSPAAGFYLRMYKLLPSQVKATGPKGHVLKEDVISYAEKNNLQVVKIAVAPPQPQK